MNFKKNNGYIGIDASISVMILLILIPIIAGMILNINRTNREISKKAEAMNIAINTIEIAKSKSVNELTQNSIFNELGETYLGFKDGTLTKNLTTYTINTYIEDYASTKEGIEKNALPNKVKIVTVTVEYKKGEKEEKIELTTPVG